MKKAGLAVLQVFGYIIAWLAVTLVIMGITKMFIWDWDRGGPLTGLAMEGLLTTLGIAVTGLLILLVTRSPSVFAGWPDPEIGLRGFGFGAMLGLVMAATMLMLTIVLGGGEIEIDRKEIGGYPSYVAGLGIILMVSSLSEEWLFRGYPLTKLADAFGRVWANLLMSVLFAAAHTTSNGFNALVAFNIVLGSLVVGALRFTRYGIPAAWGAHFAWNFTQVLCGANLSLEEIDVPGLKFVASGPEFLSGGAFGPEAGMGAMIATLAVLVLLGAYFRLRGGSDLPVSHGRPGDHEPARRG